MSSFFKTLLPGTAVFALVFFCGLFFILVREHNAGAAAAVPPEVPGTAGRETRREEKLPPLRLPEMFRAEPGSDRSWEFSGYAAANFVAARAALTAELQHQLWHPAKVIQLDKGNRRKLLLTFERNDCELIVQLTRYSTDVTGFACRREKKQPVKKGLLK